MFFNWLDRDKTLSPETLIRIVPGAEEDSLRELPRMLQDHFPELFNRARQCDLATAKQEVVFAAWAAGHALPPEAAGVPKESFEDRRQAAEMLRRETPDVFMQWIRETEAALPENFWEKKATELDMASDGDALIAAAQRERLFPSFLRFCTSRGVEQLLAGGAAGSAAVGDAGDAFLKINYLDELCHSLKSDLSRFYHETVSGASIALQGILDALPGKTLILFLGDHRFRENPHFTPAEKYESSRFIHGGGSIFEVITPAVILFKV